MEPGCIVFMALGIILTWGGFAYSLYVHMKCSKKSD